MIYDHYTNHDMTYGLIDVMKCSARNGTDVNLAMVNGKSFSIHVWKNMDFVKIDHSGEAISIDETNNDVEDVKNGQVKMSYENFLFLAWSNVNDFVQNENFVAVILILNDFGQIGNFF